MGFFKKALGKVTSLLGTGASGSGGTRDAFAQYEKYRKSLLGDINPQLAAIQNNPFLLNASRRMGTLDKDIEGQVAALRGGLQQQARAGAEQGLLAAQLASRQAAGGRGGSAFAAGAGELAGRQVQQAGVQRSEALAAALAQSSQMGLQGTLQSAQLQNQFGLGAAAQSNQARMALMQQLAGLGQASLVGGLQGDQARQGRKSGLFGQFLGGAQSMATAGITGG